MKKLILITVLTVSLLACTDTEINETKVDAVDYNQTWEDDSHGSEALADFNVVFPNDKVLRFDIVIDNSDWIAMQNDLEENLSGSGMGGGPGMGGPGGGPGMGGGNLDTDFTPVWVPCALSFENKEWLKVGIRYKGNSSLNSVFNSSIDKYSFKLDFDEFEDEYPEADNQRFYGFKQLNLNNNFEDASLMHEKVAPELFREFGLKAPHTSFVALYVDLGNGPQYFGLYTLVEEVDDTLIDYQYEFGTGNLYKPEGNGATFAQGSFNEAHMYKKNNEENNDYLDVESLYNFINENIDSDIDDWQENIESVFDVDVFLKWLASNTVIQNWDTYGRMSHNYYLYNNPLTEKLEWIPWDNNEAFTEGKQGGSLQIDLQDVDGEWPLITRIMAIEEYREKYNSYLKDFIENVFIEDEMHDIYNGYYDLIHEYVLLEEPNYTFTSESKFEAEIDNLKQHIADRQTAVEKYLSEQ